MSPATVTREKEVETPPEPAPLGPALSQGPKSPAEKERLREQVKRDKGRVKKLEKTYERIFGGDWKEKIRSVDRNTLATILKTHRQADQVGQAFVDYGNEVYQDYKGLNIKDDLMDGFEANAQNLTPTQREAALRKVFGQNWQSSTQGLDEQAVNTVIADTRFIEHVAGYVDGRKEELAQSKADCKAAGLPVTPENVKRMYFKRIADKTHVSNIVESSMQKVEAQQLSDLRAQNLQGPIAGAIPIRQGDLRGPRELELLMTGRANPDNPTEEKPKSDLAQADERVGSTPEVESGEVQPQTAQDRIHETAEKWTPLLGEEKLTYYLTVARLRVRTGLSSGSIKPSKEEQVMKTVLRDELGVTNVEHIDRSLLRAA